MMKHLIFLLVMLATFQSYATDDAPDNGNDSSQTADSSPESGDGKKPSEEEEEEEPDCE